VGSCLSGQLDGDQGEKAEGRSSGRMIRSLAPALVWMTWTMIFGLRPVGDGSGRPDDQGGGQQKQSCWSCWENLDRVCCRHCAGIAETLGQLRTLGHPASSPSVFREARLGKKRGTDRVPRSPSQAGSTWIVETLALRRPTKATKSDHDKTHTSSWVTRRSLTK
jgi:hypothetical protein